MAQTQSIKLTIKSVYSGAKWTQAALSDIRVYEAVE
jgi:hypothetical protein